MERAVCTRLVQITRNVSQTSKQEWTGAPKTINKTLDEESEKVRRVFMNWKRELGDVAILSQNPGGTPIIRPGWKASDSTTITGPSISSFHLGISRAITAGLVLKYWLKRSTAYLAETER